LADGQDYKIRRVRERDLDEILEIEETAFTNPYPLGYLRFLAKANPETFLVADGVESLRGYIIADVRNRNEGHIISIAVNKDERRKGVARALIERVGLVFSDLEVEVVKLEVRVSNHSAIKLYETMGYRQVGMMPGYYRDGEDAIIMSLTMVRDHSSEPERRGSTM
jgi:ribosomal-protein-alanine N-acetyltransferase